MAAMWSNRGETARASGDYERAVGLYEKALTIARQIGNRDSEFIYLTNLSGARLGIQQFEQAEIGLQQVISQTSAPNSSVLPEAYTYLSEACLGQGRLFEAIKMAQKAVNLAQESESPLYLGEAWRAMGRIGAAVSKHRYQTTCTAAVTDLTTTDPVHCFAESVRVFQRVKAAGEKARTLRAWAEHELQQGDRVAARKKLLEARNTFHHLGAVHEVTITDELLRVHGGKDKTPIAS
jgi:tetratricopeptide (TPR) repeat protein